MHMEAIAMREGQTVCFDSSSACFTWKAGKLIYLNSKNAPVFTIDDEGNVWFAGRVTQGGVRP